MRVERSWQWMEKLKRSNSWAPDSQEFLTARPGSLSAPWLWEALKGYSSVCTCHSHVDLHTHWKVEVGEPIRPTHWCLAVSQPFKYALVHWQKHCSMWPCHEHVTSISQHVSGTHLNTSTREARLLQCVILFPYQKPPFVKNLEL